MRGLTLSPSAVYQVVTFLRETLAYNNLSATEVKSCPTL